MGKGDAIPATRPSTLTWTSRYGPSSPPVQEYDAAEETAVYQNSSHPPPDPVAYTSARTRSELRGVVSFAPVETRPHRHVALMNAVLAGAVLVVAVYGYLAWVLWRTAVRRFQREWEGRR